MPCATTFREFLAEVNRKRPIESDWELYETPLRRTLTTFQLTFIGMGTMIAAGLFVLTGIVAKTVTGPAVVVSYIIAAVASLLSALCYVEFACRVPRTGSAYTFTYIAIGEVWAFVIGWDLVLEYLVASAAVSRSLSGYVDSLTNNAISNFTVATLLGDRMWEIPYIAPYPDFLGCVFFLLLVLIVISGAKMSSLINTIVMIVALVAVAIIFVVGFQHVSIDNWTDYGGFVPNGAGSVIAGAATLFYSYIGFDAIAIANEETVDPRKSIPIAMCISISSTALIYTLAAAVLTLLVPYLDLNDQSPFTVALDVHGIYWSNWIVSIGAISAMVTSILMQFYCLPRSIYAMARDGLLFEFLSVINDVTKVPVRAALSAATFVVLLTVFFDQAQLVEFLSIGVLNGYVFVACALIILRYRPQSLASDEGEYASEIIELENSRSTGVDGEIPAGNPHQGVESVSSATDDARLLDHAMCIPGTLKVQFRTMPLLRTLAQFAPGQAVGVSLLASIVFQILAISLLEHGTEHILAREWWAIVLLCIFITCALLAFLLIPLHVQNEDHGDYFRVPAVPIFPGISILCNITLALKLRAVAWVRFFVWLIIGLLIYTFYGYRHSKVGQARRNLKRSDDSCRRANNEGVLVQEGTSYGSTGVEERLNQSRP